MAFLELTVRYTNEGLWGKKWSSSIGSTYDYRFFEFGTEGRKVRLSRRNEWPQTYMRLLDGDTVLFGYGSRSDDEFLECALHRSGSLCIQRDIQCTLPIFYGSDGELFALSNDYETVLRRLKKLTPNKEAILTILADGGGETYETQWEEVHVLGEGQALEVDEQGNISVRQPLPRSWDISRHAPKTDPKYFSAILHKHLENFMQKRLSGDQKHAFEVSGGLDSSLLPLYIAETRESGVGVLATVLHEGELQPTQQTKLALLAHKTGFRLVSSSMSHDPRYYPALIYEDGFPLFCHQELYEANFIEMVDRLREQDITLLITGQGGDDIYENITSLERHFKFGEVERRHRQQVDLPMWLTPQLRQEYIASTPPKQQLPVPHLSSTYHSAQISNNNIYIERGIWPITHYSDVELFHSAQSLPAYMRKKKRIMRLFYQAYNWPEIFYNPSYNEDFSPFFNRALLSGAYDDAIKNYVEGGYFARNEFIDREKLLNFYNDRKEKSQLSKEDDKNLFLLFMWMRLETNLAFAEL